MNWRLFKFLYFCLCQRNFKIVLLDVSQFNQAGWTWNFVKSYFSIGFIELKFSGIYEYKFLLIFSYKAYILLLQLFIDDSNNIKDI